MCLYKAKEQNNKQQTRTIYLFLYIYANVFVLASEVLILIFAKTY